jgi:hypothetical protein
MVNIFDLKDYHERVRIRSTKMGFRVHPNDAELGEEYFFWSYQSAKGWVDRLPITLSGTIMKVPYGEVRYGQHRVVVQFGDVL